MTATLVGIFGVFGVPSLTAMIGMAVDDEVGGVIGFVLGMAGWIVCMLVLQFTYVRRYTIRSGRITETEMQIKFPNPEISRAVLEGR